MTDNSTPFAPWLARARAAGMDMTQFVYAARAGQLCITGCPYCRSVRNVIRDAEAAKAATEASRFTKEDMDGAYRAGFAAGIYRARIVVENNVYEVSELLRKLNA